MQDPNNPYYAWNFTDTTTVSNPFPTFQGTNCTRLQQFKLDFTHTSIIQRLKPLVYKDSALKNLKRETLSVIHPVAEARDFSRWKVKLI